MPVEDHNNIPLAIQQIDNAVDNALASTGEQAVDKIKKGFDTSTDALGRPWTPNAPSTVREKGFNRPLYRYGNLQESFRSEKKRGAKEVEIYSDNPHLPIHEYGAPGANIPPRPVLQPAANWLEQDVVKDTFSDEISDAIHRSEL